MPKKRDHTLHCSFQDVSDRGFFGNGIKTLTQKWHCVPGCQVKKKKLLKQVKSK